MEVGQRLEPLADPTIFPARCPFDDVLDVLETALGACDGHRRTTGPLFLDPILRDLHQLIAAWRKAFEHPPHGVGVHHAGPADAGDVARFPS